MSQLVPIFWCNWLGLSCIKLTRGFFTRYGVARGQDGVGSWITTFRINYWLDKFSDVYVFWRRAKVGFVNTSHSSIHLYQWNATCDWRVAQYNLATRTAVTDVRKWGTKQLQERVNNCKLWPLLASNRFYVHVWSVTWILDRTWSPHNFVPWLFMWVFSPLVSQTFLISCSTIEMCILSTRRAPRVVSKTQCGKIGHNFNSDAWCAFPQAAPSSDRWANVSNPAIEAHRLLQGIPSLFLSYVRPSDALRRRELGKTIILEVHAVAPPHSRSWFIGEEVMAGEQTALDINELWTSLHR